MQKSSGIVRILAVSAVLAVAFVFCGATALTAAPDTGSASSTTVASDIIFEGYEIESDGDGAPDRGADPSSDGAPTDELAELHEDGVTGDQVTVGVIGSEFDADAPAIADNVDRKMAFHRETDGTAVSAQLVRGDSVAHDTAVAEVVVSTAPDVELRLAAVGDEPTPRTYRGAVEWLIASDVDVIVDAASYFPRDAETAAGFEAVTERAAAADVLFVTSAGNYGERHWSGTVRTDGWVAFDGRNEANRLGDGPIAGDVSVRLHWDGEADLDLYLYRYVPDGDDRVVAESRDRDGLAAIDATVPRGRYYVAVHAPSDPLETDVRLYAATHDLAHATANGSAGPVTGRHVVAVGATDADGALRPDSSRDGVTLGAPGRAETDSAELVGTSAAAPFVAGAVALVASDDDVSSTEGHRILRETAERDDDVARVDSAAAVAAATDDEDRIDGAEGPTPVNETTNRIVGPEAPTPGTETTRAVDEIRTNSDRRAILDRLPFE